MPSHPDNPATGEAGEPPTVKPSSALGRHHHGLDGLRGIGMTVVLVYHSQLGIKGAFLALSQFFTLSGFLITAMLVRAHDRGGIDLRHFWTRRIRRLMPASLVTLAGAVVFGATIASYDQATELTGQLVAAAAWVVNWHFILSDQSYTAMFAEPSPVHHLWSLSLEEQFYLFMSVGLFGLLKLSARTRVLLSVLGAATVLATLWTAHLYRSGASLDRLYLGTDTRLVELLVGALLAVVVTRRPDLMEGRHRSWLAPLGAVSYAVTIALLFVVPFTRGPFWEGGTLAYAALSALVITGILAGSRPLLAVTTLGPIPWFGRLSYGTYLFHWPIFLWLTSDRTGLDGLALFALRVGVTVPLAYASQRFLEQPIIEGRWSGWSRPLRVAAMPAVAGAVLLTSLIAVDRDAYDPLAAFRGDPSLSAPITPDDGTLDVLAIVDAAGTPVVRRMAEIGSANDTVAVTTEPFACDDIRSTGSGATCTDWAERWPKLVRDLNPDVVLFFVDDWSPEAVAAASGRPARDALAVTEEVLDDGFETLTGQGAPVVIAHQTRHLGLEFAVAAGPFRQAIDILENRRDDLRRIASGRIPDPTVLGQDAYVEQGAAALIADLSLYQRAPRDRLPRVLVVGDSQARSLAFGLERWGAAQNRASVWNAATPGCGLVDEGSTDFNGQWVPVSDKCSDAVRQLPTKIESFDPDLVIVLSSVWDLSPRRLDGDEVLTPEDGSLGAFLRATYEARLAELTAGGAAVVWMTAPCLLPEDDSLIGSAGKPPWLRWLNDEVIAPLVDGSAQAEVFDLAGLMCPAGRPVQSIEGVGVLRADGMHFSVEGSIWFAETHGDEILRLGGL